jgi:hypothetical protein
MPIAGAFGPPRRRIRRHQFKLRLHFGAGSSLQLDVEQLSRSIRSLTSRRLRLSRQYADLVAWDALVLLDPHADFRLPVLQFARLSVVVVRRNSVVVVRRKCAGPAPGPSAPAGTRTALQEDQTGEALTSFRLIVGPFTL